MGRKSKPEKEKVRTKQVYLTDPEEQQLLKKHKKKTLTELLRDETLTTSKSVPTCQPVK